MERWNKGEVLENKHWNERLCSIRIKAALPKFKAGQFTRLALPEGDGMLARAYSLVNAPDDPIAEFYFNRVPDGPFSTRLHGLQVGDSVYLSATVAGFLTLSEIPDCEHLWMLATGTALGPFLSILKTDYLWQRIARVVLVHGVRTADELTYGALLDSIQTRYPEQFIRICSVTRERVDGALQRRIPAAITSGELESAAGMTFDPATTHVMICGSPEMVTDCSAALAQKGLRKHRRRAPGHISVEIYK